MRIAILLHESDRGRDLSRYHVFQLARHWQHDGHEVVPVFGTARFVPADVALLHIDLSVVPERYRDFAARYPLCMNRSVGDIRKSRISRQAVRPGDGWDGAVILKSDLNAAGGPDRINAGRWRRMLASARRHMLALAGRKAATTVADYRVFAHVDDIPAALSRHPDAFIERFLPEREGPLYLTRSMVFVGTAFTCQLLRSPDPIVRISNAVSVEECQPHPDMVRLSREMGYDYGKFDYVMHDGQAVLIDANKTTGSADMIRFPVIGAMRERRAQGLYGWLAEQQRGAHASG